MILNRYLSGNQLSGTIPSSIGSLVNLQELYAQSNTIHRYSPIITNNTKQNTTIDTHIRYLLVVMILNRGLNINQLSGTIPSSIGSLVNLQELYAQSNTIHKIFSNHHQQHQAEYNDRYSHWYLLVVMILNRDLNTNQLSGTIPSSIGSLVNLQYLYVKIFSNHHQHQAEYNDRYSHSILVGGDDIEQGPQHQSTERHHSIIDWLSRESSGVVRSIQYHPQDILQSSPTTPSRIQRSILTLVLVGGDDIEQGPQHQSTEWHHSIIDWLSRESSVLVRQDILQSSSTPSRIQRSILTFDTCWW